MRKSYISELLNIILLGIIMILVFFRGCGGGGEISLTDTITTVSYVRDTVWHQLPQQKIYVPQKVIVRDIPANVDTAAVLLKYFSDTYYEETISDSNIDIRIKDTLNSNMISWRDVQYFWKKPTAIITNKITQVAPAKTKLFVGFMLGGNKETISMAAPQLLLLNKSDNGLMAGYNFIDKTYQAGVVWKINLRKRKR